MIKNNNLFTIPNLLSLSRIIILPLVVYIIKNDVSYKNFFIILFLLFFIATDYLDGYLARKLKKTSKLGKILDPLADKICIITVSCLITKYKSFPLWAFYIILVREFIVIIGSTILIKKKNFIPISNIIGKASVFFISLSILGYLFLSEHNLIPYTLLIIGLTLYIISFFLYLLRYLKIMEYIQKHIIKIYSYFQKM